MANYITYTDKVGIVAKTVHVNQWWDDDANEVKDQHNLNDDRITALEAAGTTVLWANIEDIGDLTLISSPVGTDELVIERAGVKYNIPLSGIGNTGGDHASLSNLDYASAAHTGFQPTLTEGTGINITGVTISSEDSEIDHNSLDNYDANRHFLESEIEITLSQISDYEDEKPIQEMQLPASGDVAGRVSGAVLPSGWSIAASGVDLIVTHGLSKRVMDVKIYAVTGTEEQQLRNTASDNGIVTTDTDTLKIQSLATINKVLKVYISFV